jgi:hypothetical protein
MDQVRKSRAGFLDRDGGFLRLRLRTSDIRYGAALVDILPSATELQASELIEIDLADVPSFYPSAVAPLCTWFLSHRPGLSHAKVRVVKPNDSGATEWLEKVGFFDALINGQTLPKAHSLTVALHAIDPSDRSSTEAAIEHISNLLRSNARGFAGDVLHSTLVALAEVVENVSRHSQLSTPGFVCGQYHPTTHRFSLCVADSGIGLSESFRTGPYPPARERLAEGEDPRELAVEALMSSKYGMGHSGYGLFYASELCSLANGRFLLSSDEGTLDINGNERRTVSHTRWLGTIVNVMIDTTVPVSGSQIWSKLPSENDEGDWYTTFANTAPPPFIAMWNFGTRLYTRDSARQIRESVRSRVTEGTPISLANITTMTPSFADEFFRVLFEDIGEERYRKRVQVLSASDYLKRLIELVLRNRPSVRRPGIGAPT